jgi:hypothetical protein
MGYSWNTIIWQQFGAALDMLENALTACPADLWRDSIWEDPTDAPEYTQYWFIVFHTLAWLDRYLSGAPQGFTLPPPFISGALPDQPYTQAELQAYAAHCRQKGREIFAALTDEQASQPCVFPWGEPVSYGEMQLHNLRHVQEHASQLSLHLGRKTGTAPDWVSRGAG